MIDTQEKRMNATKVGRPWMRSHFPTAIDEQWRIETGLAYGGNALSPVAATAGFVCIRDAAISGPSAVMQHSSPYSEGTISSARTTATIEVC